MRSPLDRGTEDARPTAHGTSTTRRGVLAWLAAAPALPLLRPAAPAAAAAVAPDVTVPLSWCDGAWCASMRVGGTNVRAIVDTGSPFAMALAPGSVCSRRYGCPPSNDTLTEVGLSDTYEIFSGGSGDVLWRAADVDMMRSFSLTRPDALAGSFQNVTMALVSGSIVSPPGGLLLGLVKEHAPRIRPSFFETAGLTSFAIGPMTRVEPGADGTPARPCELRLSRRSLVPGGRSVLPLTDLRRFNDPLRHYAVEVEELTVNGRVRISGGAEGRRKTYALLDTGETGFSFASELSSVITEEPARIRSVSVRLRGAPKDVVLKSSRASSSLFIATSTELPWFSGQQREEGADEEAPEGPPFIIVLGLSFFEGKTLAVDNDRMLAQLT